MNLTDETIRKYLPEYLSAETYETLLQELKAFPDNIDERLYTTDLEKNIIYQGDGIKNLPIVNLGHIDSDNIKYVPCLILSNTCDLDLNNTRFFSTSMMYAPIINLQTYISTLEKNNIPTNKLNSHIDSIKKQYITQIMYFPANVPHIEESIVFLDRICHIDNRTINRDELDNLRLFSLSDYGFYLLLFKLSVHFSRIQEKVSRGHI